MGFIAYGFLTFDTEGHFGSNFGAGTESSDENYSRSGPFSFSGDPLESSRLVRTLAKIAAVITCMCFLASILICMFMAFMTSHLSVCGLTSSTREQDGRDVPVCQCRTVALIRILEATGYNYLTGVLATNFLAVSVLLYCITLLPAGFGVIGIVCTVAFWFTPDKMTSMYARSTGALVAIHDPTWAKVLAFNNHLGHSPRNQFPTLMGGQLELKARREAMALIETVLANRQKTLEIENLLSGTTWKTKSINHMYLRDHRDYMSPDLWYIMKPILEESKI
ncbi:unnamed protein product [Amoebophrya sp. A25]|nr:unnamed protein product [Amoebophrya sp. A25]|eukprot:GSA25T00016890001.1